MIPLGRLEMFGKVHEVLNILDVDRSVVTLGRECDTEMALLLPLRVEYDVVFPGIVLVEEEELGNVVLLLLGLLY